MISEKDGNFVWNMFYKILQDYSGVIKSRRWQDVNRCPQRFEPLIWKSVSEPREIR